MRFLLVASFPDSLITFRGSLIDALLSKGIAVHVAAPNLDPCTSIYRELYEKGVEIHNIPLRRTGMNPFSDLYLLFSLWRLIRRTRPRYIFSYTVKPVIYGSIAARLAGVPYRFALMSGLGYAFTGQKDRWGRLLRRVIQQLYLVAFRGLHGVFFQNPDDQELFLRLGLLRSSITPCLVNGSGIDISRFAPSVLPETVSFLLIARLLGGKGIREYAAAAAMIKERNPSTRFSLVGWIDSNPDTVSQQELDEWTEGGALEYLGEMDDVRPVISDCSVYVLPSYREGTPRTVLEAMAMGRAIITTDVPGCRETVIDGENGFLVPVKSVDALAAAMMRFLDDPALCLSMGARSREIAEERYDVHKVNEVMLSGMGIS